MRRVLRLTLFLTAILVALSGCEGGGDRVLVSKFQYASHLSDPKRFEVVVFKYPERPVENNVPKNYIKRLLGLPGEIIAKSQPIVCHVAQPKSPSSSSLSKGGHSDVVRGNERR